VSDILKVNQVVAGYAESVILSDITFSMTEGQTLALLGRNGVGKTTLINTLMGVTRLHSGEIFLDGQAIQHWPSYKRVNEPELGGIGWVPQERDIFKSLTVHENLTAVYRQVSHPHAWSPERAYEFFPRLQERQSNLGNQLSGGEQQMLALARALMVNPRLLLLDEPLEGLAPIIVQEILSAIRRITREEGMTAIIVEQHPQMILAIADQALVLDRGQVVLKESAPTLLSRPDVLDELLGVKH
jgi:branched-chain amino acid transport system ATP-binding protein